MHRNSNTGGLGTKWAYMWLKNGSHALRSHVRLLHVLRPSSATWSLILDFSTCSMVCRRHDNPKNGHTGDPIMVRLP